MAELEPRLFELPQCDNSRVVTKPHDPTFEVLLDLDGQVLAKLADFWSTVDAVLRERGVIP